MSLALSIAGILIGLAIAVWQKTEADRAKSELNKTLTSIPSRVAQAMRTVVDAGNEIVKTNREINAGQMMDVEYADFDGDGRKELIVQYPGGAHGSILKVFGWKKMEFKELATLSVGTPVGFQIGDFDRDGQIEFKTEETDWSSGLCYAKAPRVILIYRWDGKEFQEIFQKKPSTPTPIEK